MFVNCRQHPGREINCRGFEQRLRLAGVVVEPRLHTLKRNSFVCRVLVDQVHTTGTFGDDIGLMRLANHP